MLFHLYWTANNTIIFFIESLSLDPMTPNYHTPLTPFPLELKEDYQLMINLNQVSSSSPASCHRFFEPVQQHEEFYRRESHLLQKPEKAKIFFSKGGSCDHPEPAVMDESGSGLKRSENHQSNNSSIKWMSSKMRLMKKMMNSDAANNSCMQKLEDDQIQKQPPSPSLETDKKSYSNNNANTNPIRVCADCHTTKTPLWRSGPRGPKSLCNACGIRQRKARRAMAAAAAAAANGTAADASSNKKKRVQDKDKITSRPSNNNSCLPFKKRCKFNSNNSPSHGKNKHCFEDLTIILSKNSSALQRVFPQDEKEAAILLMALSHGLVHG